MYWLFFFVFFNDLLQSNVLRWLFQFLNICSVLLDDFLAKHGQPKCRQIPPATIDATSVDITISLHLNRHWIIAFVFAFALAFLSIFWGSFCPNFCSKTWRIETALPNHQVCIFAFCKVFLQQALWDVHHHNFCASGIFECWCQDDCKHSPVIQHGLPLQIFGKSFASHMMWCQNLANHILDKQFSKNSNRCLCWIQKTFCLFFQTIFWVCHKNGQMLGLTQTLRWNEQVLYMDCWLCQVWTGDLGSSKCHTFLHS